MERHDFTALLLVNHKYKVKTKPTNKHVVDTLNINCMPVFGQPHIQVESRRTEEQKIEYCCNKVLHSSPELIQRRETQCPATDYPPNYPVAPVTSSLYPKSPSNLMDITSRRRKSH